MADTTERSSVLDAFASAPPRENLPAPLQGQVLAPPRVVGAQKVAVMRDENAVLNKLRVLAQAAGDAWGYRFPVKNRRENRTDYIEGPSIKLANDLARTFGNCAVDTIVQDLGDGWLIYARFVDFETGFEMTRPFQQRKNQRSVGGGDDARALDIALQIGVSKAIRNVVCNALQTFADFAFEEARNSLVDKIGKALPQWRERTKARVADMCDPRRVEAVIGRPFAEMLAPDIARVVAMGKAVADGMATLDETFPPLGAEAAEAEGKTDDKLDKFADGAKPAGKRGGGQKADAAHSEAAPAAKTSAADTPSKTDQANAAGEAGTGQERSETQATPAGPGTTFAKEVEEAAGDPAREQTASDIAWDAGYAARRKGVAKAARPKTLAGAEAEAWNEGWDNADAEQEG